MQPKLCAALCESSALTTTIADQDQGSKLTISVWLQAAKRGAESDRYRGVASTVNSILRREGVLGFYTGIRTKILQSVLAAALMFLLKERLHDAAAAALRSLPAAKR